MDTFENYLSKISIPDHQARTKEILAWVSDKFPQLETRIAWSQPMFTDHGTFIIGFSIAKKHLAFSPEKAAIERFAAELDKAGYAYTEMIVRIPWECEVEYALLEKIIRFNIEDKKDYTAFWRK
ncbi:MAG: iron chaperone [Saccharofermentanales bacterium]